MRQITRQIKRNKRTHKCEQVKKIRWKSRDNPDKPRGQSMKSLTVNISKIFMKFYLEIYPTSATSYSGVLRGIPLWRFLHDRNISVISMYIRSNIDIIRDFLRVNRILLSPINLSNYTRLLCHQERSYVLLRKTVFIFLPEIFN